MNTPGYSHKPLLQKLNWKPEYSSVLLFSDFHDLDTSLFTDFDTKISQNKKYDFILLGTQTRSELEEIFQKIAQSMTKDAILWICWPKQSSKIPTDITENTLRDIFLPKGLVDIKVCAVSSVWSGLKFMYRRELR